MMEAAPPPSPVRARRSRFVPAAIAFAALFVIAVTALLGFGLKQSYDQPLLAARRETRTMVNVLTEHTTQVLGRVEAVLAGVVADLPDPQSPAWPSTALMHQFLSSRGATDGPISSISVIDSA